MQIIRKRKMKMDIQGKVQQRKLRFKSKRMRNQVKMKFFSFFDIVKSTEVLWKHAKCKTKVVCSLTTQKFVWLLYKKLKNFNQHTYMMSNI